MRKQLRCKQLTCIWNEKFSLNWKICWRYIPFQTRGENDSKQSDEFQAIFRPALVWFPQPIVSRIEESMATSTHIRKFLKPHLFIYLFIYLLISTRIGLSFIRSYSRSSQLLKLSPMLGNPGSLGFSIRRRWFRTQVHILDSGLFVNGTWTTDSNLSGIPNYLSCIPDSKAQDSRFPGSRPSPFAFVWTGPIFLCVYQYRICASRSSSLLQFQTNFVTFFLISSIFCCRLKVTSLSEFHSNTNSLRCNDTK